MSVVGTNDPTLSVHLKAFIATGEEMVVGIVGEGSSRELTSLWESPFENETAGSYFSRIGGIVQAKTGLTSKSTLNTTQVWSGTTPLTFNLVLEFYATADPATEVLAAVAALEKAASPEMRESMPGGRVPDTVALNVGRQIIYPECVITHVSKQLDGPISRDGYPLQAQVTLTLQTLASVNKSAISETFRL
ncbi:hypothetical protein ACFQH5_15115 [Halomonas salifodinae]|uniref:Morphogenetic protein n=1 Tax=Halomonas salifodinae TaxID=438745 RepID=A0ABW2F1X3_9GAMM